MTAFVHVMRVVIVYHYAKIIRTAVVVKNVTMGVADLYAQIETNVPKDKYVNKDFVFLVVITIGTVAMI